MNRRAWIVVGSIVLLAIVAVGVSGRVASDARLDKAAADRAAEIAQQRADSLFADLALRLVEDSIAQAELEDSVAAYRTRSEQADRQLDQARRRASEVATSLVETLTAEQAEQFQEIEAVHAEEVSALTQQRDDARAEVDLWKRQRENAVRLLATARQESANLRLVVEEQRVSLAARDAIIKAQRVEMVVWRGAAAAGVVAALAQAFNIVG